MYRPLFLRIARCAGRPLSGRAQFRSSRPEALESLAALYFFLGGTGAGAALLPGGAGIAGPALELSLSAQPPDGGLEWEGEGELRADALCFSFALGRTDILKAREGEGDFERIVLPEGSAAHYAGLDRAECAASARASRILPDPARARVAAFLGARR